MSTITPILDTLLHQVLGRRADLARFTETRPQLPLLIARLPGARDAATQTALAGDRTPSAKTADSARTASAREGGARRVSNTPGQVGGRAVGQATASAQPRSAQLHCSSEGRVIASLLSQFATAPVTTSATMAPLFSGSRAPTAAVLAALLGGQVANSGVFYESHLLKWLGGKYAFKQLRQEPQGRLPPSGRSGGGQASTTAAPGRPLATPADATATAARTGTAPTAATAAGGGTAAQGAGPQATALPAAATGQSAASPVHDSLLPVVRQQLDALSGAVFRWQGLAWPDAPMQWEVREHGQEQPRDHANEDGDEDDVARYSTRLKLDLPALGTLEVRILLAADTLKLYAWTATAAGAAALRPETPALRRRLEQVGFDGASVQLLTDKIP